MGFFWLRPSDCHYNGSNHLVRGASSGREGRELAALKRMFRLAKRARKVAHRPYIEMLHEANVRKGFLEWTGSRSIVDRLPEALKPAFETAYITGWRIKSELLTRQKAHADLVNGWLRLEPGESKNDEGRQFPLTPERRGVLEQQLSRTREMEKASGQVIPWLFHRDGKPIKSLRRAWRTACKRAGLTDRIPHDFRRTAGRNLERAGVSRSAAMKMVGHKTQSIYARYAIADESMLQDGGAKTLGSPHEGGRRSPRGGADHGGPVTLGQSPGKARPVTA
jgi:integrase